MQLAFLLYSKKTNPNLSFWRRNPRLVSGVGGRAVVVTDTVSYPPLFEGVYLLFSAQRGQISRLNTLYPSSCISNSCVCVCVYVCFLRRHGRQRLLSPSSQRFEKTATLERRAAAPHISGRSWTAMLQYPGISSANFKLIHSYFGNPNIAC